MKGIIESAFADLAKIGESRLSSCLKKTISTAQIKRKPDTAKNMRARTDGLWMLQLVNQPVP